MGFECRLADVNGWTLGHASAVVREYRRFLVLTQVAGAPACPSDDVDQAWHLHITRTADYARFCTDAFGRFLHHQPSSGAPGELERHREMYKATLAAYRRAFGAAPPPAVWPPAQQRFQAVDGATPASIRLPGPFVFAPFLAVATLAGAVLAAMSASLLGPFDAMHRVSGPAFLLAALATMALLGLLGMGVTTRSTRPRPRDVLDPYEIAWLAGGPARVAAMAAGLLVERGHLRLHGTHAGSGRTAAMARLVVAEPARSGPLHPVERACLGAARAGALRFDDAMRAVEPWAGATRRRLIAAGLAEDAARLELGRLAVLLAATGCLVVGLERLVHALVVARPLGWLAFLTLADVAMIAGLTLRLHRANGRGKRLLRSLGDALRIRHARLERVARNSGSPPPTDARTLPLTLALMGPSAVLAQTLFEGLDQAIGPAGMRRASAPPNDSGACGGGSGCGGGGGCGGGCGGCGG